MVGRGLPSLLGQKTYFEGFLLLNFRGVYPIQSMYGIFTIGWFLWFWCRLIYQPWSIWVLVFRGVTRRIPREDWGTLGKTRGNHHPGPLRILLVNHETHGNFPTLGETDWQIFSRPPHRGVAVALRSDSLAEWVPGSSKHGRKGEMIVGITD